MDTGKRYSLTTDNSNNNHNQNDDDNDGSKDLK